MMVTGSRTPVQFHISNDHDLYPRNPHEMRAVDYDDWSSATQSIDGSKGDESPLRFRLGGRDYSVDELFDHWSGPHDIFFKVRANDGNLYSLRRRADTPEGEGSQESFRNSRPGL